MSETVSTLGPSTRLSTSATRFFSASPMNSMCRRPRSSTLAGRLTVKSAPAHGLAPDDGAQRLSERVAAQDADVDRRPPLVASAGHSTNFAKLKRNAALTSSGLAVWLPATRTGTSAGETATARATTKALRIPSPRCRQPPTLYPSTARIRRASRRRCTRWLTSSTRDCNCVSGMPNLLSDRRLRSATRAAPASCVPLAR